MSTGLKFYEKSHRYKLNREPGGPLEWTNGVTTMLGRGIAKPFLIDWAAREVAAFAADNLDTLNALEDRDARYHLLEKAHNRTRDKAAVRGTDVHAIAEDLIHGREVEVPEHLENYVNGYVRFLDAWQPEAILTERPIGNRHWWYAGTFDVIYRLRDGRVVMADNKTSKGVYGETALQLAAYAGAEFYVDENDDEQPLPDVDGLAVVHITPTGTDLYEVRDRDEAWKDWLHVLWVARASDRIKTQLGDPIAAPSFEESA